MRCAKKSLVYPFWLDIAALIPQSVLRELGSNVYDTRGICKAWLVMPVSRDKFSSSGGTTVRREDSRQTEMATSNRRFSCFVFSSFIVETEK